VATIGCPPQTSTARRAEQPLAAIPDWPNPTSSSITSEVDSSHVIMVLQPQAVTDVILERVTSNRQAELPRRFDAFGVGSADIDARDVKAQEAAEGGAEYERLAWHRSR
jgi:hypothetical protein